MIGRTHATGLFVGFALFLAVGCDSGPGEGDTTSREPQECSGTTPFVLEGACAACLEDANCPVGQACDEGACSCPAATPHYVDGACLACAESAHCGEGMACDLGSNQCADLTCPADFPYLLNGGCVACVEDGQCAGEQICRPENHSCGCADPGATFVDGICAECTKSSQCAPGEVCNDETHVCEPYQSDCPAETPVYYLGDCVECLEDADCPEEGATCHATQHNCLAPPLVCEPPTPYAYFGACVECLENAHCGADMICKDHACEEAPVSSGECVFVGTGKGIGARIGDFAAANCDGETVHLHDFCGQKKAVWLISVAGWCGACDQYAPQANALWLEYAGQGLQLLFVLGEDPGGNPPTPSYCKQWAASHNVTAPVLCDSGWKGLDSKITPGGYDLPWDYLLDGDDMTFVWESVNFDSGVLQQQINALLAD